MCCAKGQRLRSNSRTTTSKRIIQNFTLRPARSERSEHSANYAVSLQVFLRYFSLSMFQPLAWQRSGRSFRTVGTIVTKQEKKACPMRRCHSANSSIDTYIYLFARYGSGFERIFLGKFAKLRCAGQVQPELTMGKPTEHVLTIKGATMSRAMTKWSDWSVVDQSDDKCHGA